MKIGVDIRTLSYRKGGISQYTYNLVKNIIRLDEKNEYFLFNYNKSQYEWDNFSENVNEVILRLPQRHNLVKVWENLLVPITTKKRGIDLWFSPDFTIPRCLNVPSVITIFDLIFKKYHDTKDNKQLQKLDKKVRFSIKHASKIIVISKFTLKEVQAEYEIESDKIYLTHLAADERFHKIHDLSILKKVLNRYGIHFKYILFVGEISERKNITRLIHAYNLLKMEGKTRGRKLLLVGKRTTDTNNILIEVNRLKLREYVLFTGYVPDEDLPFIYNGADMFVFPSLYEGFGIPPLEAMQCKIPVIASRLTSIPEIVGDGALLFDPCNIEDIADKTDLILNKKINIDELLGKASVQADKFSWEKTAKQTIAILNEFKC